MQVVACDLEKPDTIAPAIGNAAKVQRSSGGLLTCFLCLV